MTSSCPHCGFINRAGATYCSGCGSRLSSRLGQVLAAGTALDGGRYVVRELLGQGGGGAVYLADDNRLGRSSVVKELLGHFSSAKEQHQAEQDFKREALMLARLSTEHVALPQTYDYFSDGSRYYLVMQYIVGRNLEERLKENGGPLASNEVIELASAIAEVLIFLHAQEPEPVIHRDVKPANIILDSVGRVKLVDFGLAKTLSQPIGTPLPTALRLNTSAAGTAGYTPLEQWMLVPEPRSDVYALGATIHHLLTGRDPRDQFPSRELNLDLLRAHSGFPPLRSLRSDLAPELETLVGHMVADKPSERPLATEVKEALALLRRRSSARRTGRWTAPPVPTPETRYTFPAIDARDLVREVQSWFSNPATPGPSFDSVEVTGANFELAPLAMFDFRIDARFENSSGALIGTIDEGGSLLLDGNNGKPPDPQLSRFLLARRNSIVPIPAAPDDKQSEQQPPKLNEIKLTAIATAQLASQYTRRISYVAANGRAYERLCKPPLKQVALSEFTRLYVPFWTVKLRMRGREYRFDAYQATVTPTDGQVLFVSNSTLPGTALCSTCGSLNRKEAMIRCQQCGKGACPRCTVQRSKLGIFRKQFCSDMCAELFLTSGSVLNWL